MTMRFTVEKDFAIVITYTALSCSMVMSACILSARPSKIMEEFHEN